MKSVFVAFILFGSTSFAQTYAKFECKVEKPCQYSKSGLGYCVGHTSLRINDSSPAGPTSHLVVEQSSASPFEIFMVAADIPMSFSAAGNAMSGNTQNGDDWAKLSFSPDQKAAFGKMTLEQDFEFSLACVRQK